MQKFYRKQQRRYKDKRGNWRYRWCYRRTIGGVIGGTGSTSTAPNVSSEAKITGEYWAKNSNSLEDIYNEYAIAVSGTMIGGQWILPSEADLIKYGEALSYALWYFEEYEHGGGGRQFGLLNEQSLLTQSIPLAGATTSVDGCPAIKFLNERGAIVVPNFDTALEALTKGHYLVVEPITWLYIPSNGKNYPAEGNRTYGSYYNIANKWVQQGGTDTGGFYTSYMTDLGNNCMLLNSPITTDTGATFASAINADRNISQSVTEMAYSGLSLHIYSSDSITNVREPEPSEAEGDFVLQESEISKPFETGTKTSEAEVQYTYDDLEDCEGHCGHSCDNNCAGGYYDTYPSCGFTDATHSHIDACFNWNEYYCGHSSLCTGVAGSCLINCNSFDLIDDTYTFKLKNTKESSYPKLLALQGGKFSTEINDITTTRVNTSALTEGDATPSVSGFNYKFVLYRGDDKLTYAKYKNDINTLGFSAVQAKEAPTRDKSTYTIKDFTIDLGNNDSDLITTAKGDLGCENEDPAVLAADPVISYTGTVTVKVYAGKERTSDTTVNNDTHIRLTSLADDMTRGRMVSTNTSIKFNPYIKMTYAGLDKVKHEVDVLGEYRREILPNDYAEIAWTLEEDNLQVQSQMWMTHARVTSSTDDLVWTDRNQVLSGGSLVYLTASDKVISMNTYQTIVPSNTRGISEISGSALTENDAIEAHRAFVSTGLESLDNLELVQYVSTKVNGEDAWKNGIQVTSGSDISPLKNTVDGVASTDAKYYLDTDINNVQNVQRSDLDVYEIGTTPTYYRFYSDTKGNIYMVSAGTLAEVEAATSTTPILTKSQGVASLTGKALFLDNRTKVVTKLLAAIERNTGNDTSASWASDGRWYNEAYDGIVIIEQCTSVKVGLGVNNKRQLIIDPKLTPKSEGKSDMGSAAHATGFKVNLKRTDVISTFKGTEVYMENPDLLFNSRTVYLTNMTVQDNN